MRRYAVTDVVLGLVFVGFGALGLLLTIVMLREPWACGDAPCSFYETWRSRDPAYAFGFSLVAFAIGGRLIWNVWRGQG